MNMRVMLQSPVSGMEHAEEARSGDAFLANATLEAIQDEREKSGSS
jgi:hypothetical protein